MWWASALFGLLLALLATLFPTYRAPDEHAHVDMVHAVRDTWRYPDVGERTLSEQMVGSYPLVGYRTGQPGDPPALARSDAPPRDRRPSFDEVAPDTPTDLVNQMSQHPPAYYAVMAGALAVIDEIDPGAMAFDAEVLALRLVTTLLVLPIPLLIWAAATRLGAGREIAVGAALVPLTIPMLAHIGASVNNDNLLVLLGAGLAVPVAAVLRGDVRPRVAIAAGLLTGLSLLTKGFALVLPVWMAIAYVVAWRRGAPAARTITSASVALGTAMVAGGWWWIRNVVVYGAVQPSGGAPAPAPPAGFEANPLEWGTFFVGRMVRRFWIEPDTVMRTTPVLVAATSVLLGVAVLAGLLLRRREEPASPSRLDVAVMLAPAAGILAIVVFGAWRAYARTAVPFAIHGRYLFPAITGIGIAAAAGLGVIGDRVGRLTVRTPMVVATVAVVMHAAAVRWALLAYWGGTTIPERLASWLAWVP